MQINGTRGSTRFKRDLNCHQFNQVYQDDDTDTTLDSESDACSEGSYGLYKFRNGRFRRLFPPAFCRFQDFRRGRYDDSDDFSDETDADEEYESNEDIKSSTDSSDDEVDANAVTNKRKRSS
jgi:hypothetical protein